MRQRYFEPGDFVILEPLTVSMLDADFGLTSTPGPPWRHETSVCCRFSGGEVAVALATCDICSEFHDDDVEERVHTDTYVRVLAPRGVGWIHANYLERV